MPERTFSTSFFMSCIFYTHILMSTQPNTFYFQQNTQPYAMQTRVLTILFTDMQGFTSRTSQQSRQEIEDLLIAHDQILRPLFSEYYGRVIKTIGDSFMVSFDSPTDAVLSGIAIQKAIRTYNAIPGNMRIDVRIGINSGEVHVKNNDVFGEAVNIAARIESMATPGTVVFSEAAFLSMNKNEIRVIPLGYHQLKGIPRPIKLYKVWQSVDELNALTLPKRSPRAKKQQLKHLSLLKDVTITKKKGIGTRIRQYSPFIFVASLLSMLGLVLYVVISYPIH